MPGPYKVSVKVTSTRGSECPMGFKDGDSWIIKETGLIPQKMCNYAWGAIFVPARVFRFGGEFPQDKDKSTTHVRCPSVESRVIFEIKRIQEEKPA